MSSPKPRVLVYGNCQGGWFANLLQLQPAIAERFEVVYLANFGTPPADHPIHTPDFLASCSVLLWQTAAGHRPPALLDGLPSTCRQIRFPTLALKVLWPFHADDPRNAPQEGFPYGPFPYGDRIVMRLLHEGVAPEDVPRRYLETDVRQFVDLDRYAKMAFAELRINDTHSDIAVATLIENAFRDRRLFHTINHAAFPLLESVYRDIERALTGSAARSELALPPNSADICGHQQIPVHPQVIAHFNLAWATPSMRWRYHSAFLTLPEYLRAYADFSAPPNGNPPDLWLQRARQSAALGDFEEARRILLYASVSHPALHHFLQFLATLLVRANRLTEAEQVLRYALSRHPDVAGLHLDLGRLMLQSRFADEAARCLREVLRIEPSHAEATKILRQIDQPKRRRPPAAAQSDVLR